MIGEILQRWRAEIEEQMQAAEAELAEARERLPAAQLAAEEAAAARDGVLAPFAQVSKQQNGLAPAVAERVAVFVDAARKLEAEAEAVRRQITAAVTRVADLRGAVEQLDEAAAGGRMQESQRRAA